MGRPSKQTPEPPAAGLSLPGGVRLVAWCQGPAAVHRFGRRPVALTLMIESATLAAKRLVLVGLVAQAAIATDRPCSCSHHGPRPADSSLVGCANQLLKRATRRGEARASKQFFGSKTQGLLHRCYTAVTPLLHRCYRRGRGIGSNFPDSLAGAGSGRRKPDSRQHSSNNQRVAYRSMVPNHPRSAGPGRPHPPTHPASGAIVSAPHHL